jgi:CheY-like chemotaxis protein
MLAVGHLAGGVHHEPGMTDASSRGQRVLVVNDTQEILELFDAILSEMGFEVVLMSYAPRELARIREVAPDLVILDFLMGDRELLGWQLLQKLKMDRTLDSIPVIVCTAAVKAVEEQQGYLTEQGVQIVLKPFNVDQLEEAVRTAVQQRPTARGIAQQREPSGSRRAAG